MSNIPFATGVTFSNFSRDYLKFISNDLKLLKLFKFDVKC